MALVWVKTATSVPTDYSGDSSVSHTYSGVAIGTASADRKIVVKLVFSGERTITAVTVGGEDATEVVVSGTSIVLKSSMWIAEVPTGTTANIVVTMDFNVLTLGICVGAMTGSALTASDTYAVDHGWKASIPMNVVVPTGGIMLFAIETETANTITLDKGTFDYQSEGVTYEEDTGYYQVDGDQTVTASDPGMSCAVAAAWGTGAERKWLLARPT